MPSSASETARASEASGAADFFAPDATTRRLGPDRRQRPTRMLSRYWLRGRRRGVRRGTDKQYIYVDRYTKAEWIYVIGIVLMSLADLLLTLNYLANGGEEANPFMRWTIEWGGTLGFAGVKMFLTVAGALFLLIHARFRRVRFFMMVLFGGYVALMLYHSYLLARTGG
ncbi:MAG: hypothetical protein DHS20C15_19740 [Planctomycetota bacterium]|nr:MAG: hypothetical protein DHS20C15_19740 [Planctomycetota bacterium]